MQKTAVGVMLAGFVLAFFAIQAFGIDLLIDAVGFLLVFNSARALRTWDAAFTPASLCALGLVAVSALQLFFTAGGFAAILALLRCAGQAALYLFLAAGLGRLLAAVQRRLAAASRAVFWAGAAVNILCALLPLAVPSAAAFCGIVLFISQVLIALLLFFAWFLPGSLLH